MRPVMLIWMGNWPIGWMALGIMTLTFKFVGGKTRMEVLSLTGSARWTVRVRETVMVSDMAQTAWLSRT